MRHRVISSCVLALLALPISGQVQAQTAGADRPDRSHVPAPWWMRDPVIASQGAVHVELPANRARFQATFSEVARDAPDAVAAVARRSAALDTALQAFGTERVQYTRTVTARPLYRQYRDEAGNRIANQRADQIENYEAVLTVQLQIVDVSVIEAVYNAVASASPSRVDDIYWELRADDATISRLAIAAVRDATRRARESTEAAGSRLGLARVIDPSGGVCETQVLAGWPDESQNEASRDAGFAPPPPPPAPPPPPGAGNSANDLRLTLRPPLMRLADRACVVFGLLPN